MGEKMQDGCGQRDGVSRLDQDASDSILAKFRDVPRLARPLAGTS
jgi:hypothetical protein